MNADAHGHRRFSALACLAALALLGACSDAPEAADAGCDADACARDGGLCEADACVRPWAYGAPEWSACDGEPRATAESLAEKAAHYDAIAMRLQFHPKLGWVSGVTLKGTDLAPDVPQATATVDDVEAWHSGENDGLWNGLYLASQAFRFAATESAEALANVRRVLEGEVSRMKITGVPGIFTRQYIPPGVAGIACPGDDASYVRSATKKDNRWLQIREDGCVWRVDDQTMEWTKYDHCGLDDFAGYCLLENVSKDEYAGHMFALGAVYELVDDEAVQATVIDLLGQFGRHLMENDLTLTDWDGRVTEHGRFAPLSFDDYPGFNAAMGMSFVSMAVEATGDAGLRDFYDECMLMTGGSLDCFPDAIGVKALDPYPTYLAEPGLYLGPEGCTANYNNLSMHMLSMFHLIGFERDPERRAEFQRSLDLDVVRPAGQPRAIIHQNNAWFDVMWAAKKALGPGTDGPAYDAVENAVCMLRQFRPSNEEVTLGPPPGAVPYCKDRFDADAAEHPREAADRCSGTFVWWGSPYGLGSCTADARNIAPPTGYLLPYWMARYFGFVSPDA